LFTILFSIVDNSVHNYVFLLISAHTLSLKIMQIRIKTVKLQRGVLLLALIVIAAVSLGTAAPFVVSAARQADKVTVVIDPGHGGIDGGVSGVKTGVQESKLTLQMSKLVGEYLEASGFNVVYTRKGDSGLYGGSGNKKRQDMERRAKIINKAKPAAVVSIHMNKFSSPSRRGAQVFFNRASLESRNFATVMQDVLNQDFNLPDTKKEYTALAAQKFILECTGYPVIILECGFLSNPLDEANLTNPIYQAEFCQSIAKGIIIFLSA